MSGTMMDAKTIREVRDITNHLPNTQANHENDVRFWMAEIAAQLAEMNANYVDFKKTLTANGAIDVCDRRLR
jgi:hypothetical protein